MSSEKLPQRVFWSSPGNRPLDFFVMHGAGDVCAQSRAQFPEARHIFGFRFPDWQRPAVWTMEQKVRFIESCYLGLDIGRFVFTEANYSGFQGPLDNLLLDGQQRLGAIQDYLAGAFEVFGLRFLDLDERDQRRFRRLLLPSVFIEVDAPWGERTVDEALLKELYVRMNYGGTPHSPEHHPGGLLLLAAANEYREAVRRMEQLHVTEAAAKRNRAGSRAILDTLTASLHQEEVVAELKTALLGAALTEEMPTQDTLHARLMQLRTRYIAQAQELHDAQESERYGEWKMLEQVITDLYDVLGLAQ